MLTPAQRDHGGGLDSAAVRYGGRRIDWIDLSTGINPVPYPVPELRPDAWTALPDAAAALRLEQAARRFWNVPDGADVLAAGGASALIARMPALHATASVCIPGPTYNEHAAAFAQEGWQVLPDGPAKARVIVHPNNPDGRCWDTDEMPVPEAALTVIDESFCDICPERSLIAHAARPGTVVLKSFGKFWGLAGLRLGFAIGEPRLIGRLRAALGPWAVSGPAMDIGAAALEDPDWARATRLRLAEDAARMDTLLQGAGAQVAGGTSLFRLYRVSDAAAWQDRLARHRIWSRVFPYDPTWLRLGLPHPEHWSRLEAALA